MKIVLWAYHEAGYRALRILHAGGHDLLVFTQESLPHVPSVDALACSMDIDCYTGAAEATMRERISAFQPDLGLSMYYPQIISQPVLDIPHLGAFNFHPSLLPRHRGCFSAPWAIIEGDEITGVTCHEMAARADTGKILCTTQVVIDPDDTAFRLYYKLVDAAVMLLDEVIGTIRSGNLSLSEQTGQSCYHRREVPFNGLIDTGWSQEMIGRFIRAMYFPPYPPAAVNTGTKKVPVHSMEEYWQITGGTG